MLAEAVARLSEAPEIDDAFHAGAGRRSGEGPGEFRIAMSKLVTGGHHRVHEVVRGGTSPHHRDQPLGILDIPGDDLHAGAARPRTRVELPRPPREAAHAVARLEQAGDETATDVPARPRHEDGRVRRIGGGESGGLTARALWVQRQGPEVATPPRGGKPATGETRRSATVTRSRTGSAGP